VPGCGAIDLKRHLSDKIGIVHVNATQMDAGMNSAAHVTAAEALPVQRVSRARGFGERLPGPHKWLGGATTADGTVLLGVPSNAERVVRVDLTTGTIELTAHAPRGRFKWLRGVRARDGSVYCIPACADAVLRIAADGSVTELGSGTLPEGEWKWHGGALGGDGNIYAIPANASRVLKIEPATGTVSLIGPELQPGIQNKWYGGILASDGTIWGVPYNATAALRIDPATGEVSEVGDFGTGGWKWHGGARSADVIIAVPSHAARVLRIDPQRRCALGPGPSGNSSAQSSFAGRSLARTGAARNTPATKTAHRGYCLAPWPRTPSHWAATQQRGRLPCHLLSARGQTTSPTPTRLASARAAGRSSRSKNSTLPHPTLTQPLQGCGADRSRVRRHV
jgi:hypothetical protein